ncbi:DUF362 domain-containing protein [Thermodesulfobacteriota bacterium]
MEKSIRPGNLVAVKLHFGEKGNSAFIRPVFIRQIVDNLKSMGAHPFLTDTNTLYAGTRGNSVSHLVTAIENGFAISVVGAPIIIADGMRGASSSMIKIKGEILSEAYIGKEIVESDFLLGVAHFKGHELTGFGGAIKNIGMGCASRKGKLIQHSGLSPKVTRKKCIGCGDCINHCEQQAITLSEKKASIIPEKCIGCGECILICQNKAINVRWNSDIPTFSKKMVEYTAAVLKGKQGKSLFLNFLTDISPACDCYGHNDIPIVGDIGILLSIDPVAIDQASVDLVNLQRATENSVLERSREPGQDKFSGLYPKVNWPFQLEYAEQLGLGIRKYDLISI